MKSITNKKAILLFSVEIIVLLIVYLYHIDHLYAMVMSEDELGYWGNAAYFAGLDWGNVLHDTVYYSYGYSFILMFILKLPLSPLVMYRIAIVMNALFMLVSFGISNYLFRGLFPKKNPYLINAACFTGTLYSGYITISNFAFSECLLIMMTWLLLLQSFLLCKKKSMVRMTVFCLELCFIYIVHMRTLAYVVAGIIFLFYFLLEEIRISRHAAKTEAAKFAFACIAVLLIICISSVLKKHLQAELYVGNNNANDYGAIIRSISVSNIVLPFIGAMCGRAFYLWAATLGFLPIGFVYACKKYQIYRMKNAVLKYFYAFAVLIFLGEFALASFAQRSAGVGPVHRLDILIYGRYIEISIPFLLVIGLIHFPDIVKDKKEICYVLFSFIIFWALSYLLNDRVERYDLTKVLSYQGACAPGVFWLYSRNGFLVYLFYKVTLLFQIVFLALLFMTRKKLRVYFLELIFVIAYWVGNAYAVLEEQTIPYQERYCYGLTEETDFFEEMNEDHYTIGFLSGVEYSTRGNVQFYLKNTPLICINLNFEELTQISPEILLIEHRGEVEEIDIQIDRVLSNNTYYYVGEMGIYQVYAHSGTSIKSIKAGNTE